MVATASVSGQENELPWNSLEWFDGRALANTRQWVTGMFPSCAVYSQAALNTPYASCLWLLYYEEVRGSIHCPVAALVPVHRCWHRQPVNA